MGRPLLFDDASRGFQQAATSQAATVTNLIGRVTQERTPLVVAVPPEAVFHVQEECRVFQPVLSFDAGVVVAQWRGFHLHFLYGLPDDTGVYFKLPWKSAYPHGELLHLGTMETPIPAVVQHEDLGDESPVESAYIELAAGTAPPHHRPPAVQFGEVPNLRWLEGEDRLTHDEFETCVVVPHARPACLHCSQRMPFVGCLSTDSCSFFVNDTYIYLYFCSQCEVQCVFNEYC